MRQLDKLWQYQQADKAVVDYETEIRQYPLRQQLLKLRNIVADQQTVVKGMENDAGKALERLEELKAQRDRFAQLFEDIRKKLEEEAYETAAQVHKAIQQMTDAENKLRSAEKELAKMNSHSQMIENRYKEVRLKAARARDEYNKLKGTYDKEYEQQLAHLEELKNARAEVGRDVDAAYMEKYKTIRGQKFPVMVLLNQDRCAGCNMSLPSAVAKSLQGSDEIITCENCDRILYMPE